MSTVSYSYYNPSSAGKPGLESIYMKPTSVPAPVPVTTPVPPSSSTAASSSPLPYNRNNSNTSQNPPASPPSSPPAGPAAAVGSTTYGYDLTGWFINAKRSLNSTNLCARANQVVNSTKDELERTAYLVSRCLFLRNAMREQLGVVKQMNLVMRGVGEGFMSEFQSILTELDSADLELNSMLDRLKDTVLESAFIPDRSELRRLYDFVDDASIEKLRTELRKSIDQIQAAQMTHMNMVSAFDEDISTLKTTLSKLPDTSSYLNPKHNPVPAALDLVDKHAQDMAQLLEQLTHHYDQLLDALKRTSDAGHSPTIDFPEQPITEEELQVLRSDSGNVDNVVEEIKEHLSEIENIYSNQVQKNVDLLDGCHTETLLAFSQFEEFQRNLAGYLVTSSEFEGAQHEFKDRVSENLDQLRSLTEYYQEFSGAYDKMVVEVGRRIGIKNQMEKIMKEALASIEELYEQDAQKREEFKNETGPYLPADIWRGLSDPPMKYNVEPMGGDLPELKKEVLSKALRSVGGL